MANQVDCECEEWWNSAGQIFNAQVQHTIRTGDKYTGSQFKYCPWCGSLLTKFAQDGGKSAAKKNESNRKAVRKRVTNGNDRHISFYLYKAWQV